MSKWGRSLVIDEMMMEENSWNINEYLTALKAYLMVKHRVEIPFVSTIDTIRKLEAEGFLTVENDEFHSTSKLIGLFEKDDKFEEFYHKYPYKVRDAYGHQRILRVRNPLSISGRKLKQKWNRITKGNPEIIDQVIRGLENELKHRKEHGSMQYMQMLETWLNNGTWEAYLEEDSSEKSEKSDKII
jgi:hypothetical protein